MSLSDDTKFKNFKKHVNIFADDVCYMYMGPNEFVHLHPARLIIIFFDEQDRVIAAYPFDDVDGFEMYRDSALKIIEEKGGLNVSN